MFRTVSLSITRSFSLYTQPWCMSYRFADSLWTGSGWHWFHPETARKLSANLYDIYHCCVQWKTPGDGQRNWPKHAELHFKNKFEKLVHLVRLLYGIGHGISPYATTPAQVVTSTRGPGETCLHSDLSPFVGIDSQLSRICKLTLFAVAQLLAWQKVIG